MYFVLLKDFTWPQIKYRKKQTRNIYDGGGI